MKYEVHSPARASSQISHKTSERNSGEGSKEVTSTTSDPSLAFCRAAPEKMYPAVQTRVGPRHVKPGMQGGLRERSKLRRGMREPRGSRCWLNSASVLLVFSRLDSFSLHSFTSLFLIAYRGDSSLSPSPTLSHARSTLHKTREMVGQQQLALLALGLISFCTSAVEAQAAVPLRVRALNEYNRKVSIGAILERGRRFGRIKPTIQAELTASTDAGPGVTIALGKRQATTTTRPTRRGQSLVPFASQAPSPNSNSWHELIMYRSHQSTELPPPLPPLLPRPLPVSCSCSLSRDPLRSADTSILLSFNFSSSSLAG